MSLHATRLARLRAELAAQGLDGFIVPIADAHMSEYVGHDARRLEWLTGFAGSAGTAVVLGDAAALFVDGRYTLQVRQQVPPDLYAFRTVPTEPIGPWLRETAPAGARIGYDPWLATRSGLRAIETALGGGVALVPVDRSPVDVIWTDRPAPSGAPAEIHALAFAGESAEAKRGRIATAIAKAGADCAVLAALDSVAWAFNLRGADVPRTPVLRAFALIESDERAKLFVDPGKIGPEVRAHLGPGVTLAPYAGFIDALAEFGGRRVLVDPAFTVAAIHAALEAAGATIVEGRDPAIPLKAAKNPVELDGTRAAHRRDGLAVTRFLHSLEADPPADELAAEARLEAFRRQSNMLRDLSFDSISGFGPNGAVVHYRATPATNRRFEGDDLYLIDSGGQYPDGTTDVTRTVAFGTPTPEMRARFTQVVKGHIALATARFPRGTRGGQLDSLARQHLWAAGADYAHGTGHGVGHFLGVHEGPQRIAAAAGAPGIEEPLVPGMILSNEPGFYKPGHWGIRIENLVIVVEDARADDIEPMLAFETITLAPIDRQLIEPALLTVAEVAWLDAYHARVREAHAASLEGAARDWLDAATAPLLAERRAAA